MPVAATFFMPDMTGRSLSSFAAIDTMVRCSQNVAFDAVCVCHCDSILPSGAEVCKEMTLRQTAMQVPGQQSVLWVPTAAFAKDGRTLIVRSMACRSGICLGLCIIWA